ncbi:hypothetical protein BOO69_09605 [Sulfitobacter alexandrii]|uniref:DUF2730 family protein n=1 Tax=Sulfitobacter alexandrii TaxID=1917485 RepID=A0A1J0WHJ2_9RHOB|nr:DUF2730 family protein [Sulfitobacter alexandrii]APE43640.1 hypothetical protein BOO69_09605 [Sulfitobacter alexandrii]
MELIAEFLKGAFAREDLWGLFAAAALIALGLYLRFNSSGKSEETGGATGSKFESVAERMDTFDKRLARVESDIEHLPTREEFHEMELTVARLDQRVMAIDRNTESTSRAVGRIEDFLISMKGKGG